MKRRLLLCITLATLAIITAIPVSAGIFQTEALPQAPAIATFAKNGTANQVFHFSSEDFLVKTGNTQLDSIVINTLPNSTSGVLTMGGTNLLIGDCISLNAVSGMAFEPLAHPTRATTDFEFTPVFADGTIGDRVNVNLYLLTSENSSPIAQNLEHYTYKNIALTAQFMATDPEGDLLTFRLVDKPKRGAVTLPEDGSTQFVYTPYENKTGKDSFTYVAIDALGNTSAPATVTLEIKKPDTAVTYADMAGVSAYKAAIRLAEADIFVGESMDGVHFFQPDTPVSRDEFVALAMHTLGLDALKGITQTGFADDAAIPTWAKGYVSSALKSGVIQGSLTADGVVFDAQRIITKAEASVLLDRLLQVSDATAAAPFADQDAAPAWAYQAAVNLESVHVLQPDRTGALSLGSQLTRADAAELLCGCLDVLDAREPAGWFHW